MEINDMRDESHQHQLEYDAKLRDFLRNVIGKDLPKTNSAEEMPDESLHVPPYFMAKDRWTELGDLIKKMEVLPLRVNDGRVDGSRFITLRMDGSNFGKTVKALRKAGALQAKDGFSTDLATIMRKLCEGLLEKFNGVCGYTQSDEITIIIPAASVRDSVQHPHTYNGRVLKLCTLAASFCSFTFMQELYKLHREQTTGQFPDIGDAQILFDCRLGSFASFEEAFSLILWRSYDCGINAVSDSCHYQRSVIDGAKQIMTAHTGDKLKWLKEHGLLPLPKHRANGTFMYKAPIKMRKFIPALQEEVEFTRRVVKTLDDKPVINMFAEQELAFLF